MSNSKTARVCQECGKKSSAQDRVKYSKRDHSYLHGACRGVGVPHSHGKQVEHREWYQTRHNIPKQKKVHVAVSPQLQEARDQMREFVKKFRESGRPIAQMTMAEYNAFSQLATTNLLEEARELFKKHGEEGPE